jgi:hypothetical protein
MNLYIREFLETPEDFAAVVEIDAACDPEHPPAMEEFRYDYEHFDTKKYVLRYYFAEKAGRAWATPVTTVYRGVSESSLAGVTP